MHILLADLSEGQPLLLGLRSGRMSRVLALLSTAAAYPDQIMGFGTPKTGCILLTNSLYCSCSHALWAHCL